MLSLLECDNYRSLERVVVPLGDLTAVVGPNGVGKTSLLKAIDLVLGTTWPSLRSLRIPQDFTDFDATSSLMIRVSFDPPLTQESAIGQPVTVPSLAVTCQPYKKSGKWGDAGDLHLDFAAVDSVGEKILAMATRPRAGGVRPTFQPVAISTGLRDQGRVLFIDHRRSVAQHLPSMRGSALGRLFEPARREYEQGVASDGCGKAAFAGHYEKAMEALRTPRLQAVETMVAETAKRMIGFLGRRVAEGVDVQFGFADPANPFGSLRLVYREDGLEIPGDELGLGVQSALVVGVFEALRQLEEPVGTVVIEEPEMYLHPQAQRYFHRLLTELADSKSCQVIYSTHSPIFADAVRFEAVRLVRRPPGRSTAVSYVADAGDRAYLVDRRRQQKLATGFDPARSELLFAARALLVEGPADRLAARLVAERLELDLDAEGVAVVDCGAKSAILFYARVCRALAIPFFVLCDDDQWPEPNNGNEETLARVRRENEEAARLHAQVVGAMGDPERLFVVSPSLEAAFEISRTASNKPARVVAAADSTPLDELPAPLVAAVCAVAAPD
jgi:energy-coupling factor transporter ATP-binding protein EcfA2